MKMEEKEEQLSAIILDEIEEKEEQFSGNELDENDGGLSGNELDELETELDKPQDQPSESIPDHESIKIASKIFKGKRQLGMFIAIGVVFLSGIGYYFIKGKMLPVKSNQINGSKQVANFAIPTDQVLVFDSFVIPFRQSTKFSYISLTIAFKLQNRELRGEMIEDKWRLRGIIYEMLSKEINRLNDVPSLEKLKDCIIRAVNGALSMGKINDAYITDLIAV
jgi:flagellar basal body-associated protein FliL